MSKVSFIITVPQRDAGVAAPQAVDSQTAGTALVPVDAELPATTDKARTDANASKWQFWKPSFWSAGAPLANRREVAAHVKSMSKALGEVSKNQDDDGWLLQRAPNDAAEIFAGFDAARTAALAAIGNAQHQRRRQQIDVMSREREGLLKNLQRRHARAHGAATRAAMAKGEAELRVKQEHDELRHLVGSRRRRLEMRLTKLTSSGFAFAGEWNQIITGPAVIPALLLYKTLVFGEVRQGVSGPYLNTHVPWWRRVSNLTELEALVDDLMGTPPPSAEKD